ncbi:DUF1836 domain-containing protein [Clostridium felsineum]|uniref:Uncharacterized protein n=1 Tax=Clostridium felsineum TaxID=36839 RepID=A0A1S8LVF7_9CLOT|nr:DUF1836 domain-containing protein [Clostridium felsineum]MCR3761005.1 DUF1836 domain-containing protein [Clostridium felsineum]URZ02406.1 hypothetical protein CLAUR_024030 [Clostridium felsineum]URZ04856.1 hypothetical protein CLROS_001800 [Clostridium felsineum]URZ09897.1 hypothetical protein CROST_006050 [Clostridium felsineum]URZ18196.1 hypothetical protein CLFE_042510 [Clostridium felsineum DSM 794]
MKEEFSIDAIKKLVEEISANSIISYDELPKLDLFLSQVIDFLNDKFESEKYTNNIVQNYIKGGVISKPEDGRKKGYTKDHVAQLLLLSYMRPVLNTEEIKKVFALAFNEINDKEDDVISWEQAYEAFSDVQKNYFNNVFAEKDFSTDRLKNIVKNFKLDKKDEEKIFVFIVVMSLVAQASVIKNIAKKIIEEYKGE